MKSLPDKYFYPAILMYEEGHEIAVWFPDFDTATQGATEEEALEMGRECLGLMIYSMERDGDPMPAPTPYRDIKCKKNERVVLVDVFMPTVREALNSHSVNRTVTLPKWLNNLAIEYDVNFSQVLQEALKERLPVNKRERLRQKLVEESMQKEGVEEKLAEDTATYETN